MKTKLQMKQRLFPMETYGAHGKVRVIGIQRLHPNLNFYSKRL